MTTLSVDEKLILDENYVIFLYKNLLVRFAATSANVTEDFKTSCSLFSLK